MLIYIGKRLLLALPIWWLITVMIFLLTWSTTQPARRVCYETLLSGELTPHVLDACIIQQNQRMGLDRAPFYVALEPLAVPPDFRRYRHTLQGKQLERWLAHYGCWAEVKAYWQAVEALAELTRSTYSAGDSTRQAVERLALLTHPQQYGEVAAFLSSMKGATGEVKRTWAQVQERHRRMTAAQATWRYYLPTLRWYGSQCLYHQWITGWLGPAKEEASGQAKRQAIWPSLLNTLRFTWVALLITLLLGTLAGFWAGLRPFSGVDQALGALSFALQAVPAFWLATLLLWGLANPDQGWSLYQMGASVSEVPSNYWLPLLAYVYGSWALVSRLLRNQLVEIAQQDHLRTAQAKGLTFHQALWRHGLRQALLLLATLIGGSLPGLLVGSVVIETVFQIQGLGELLLQCIQSEEVFRASTIFSLVAAFTLLGYLLSDLLYRALDPRIQLP